AVQAPAVQPREQPVVPAIEAASDKAEGKGGQPQAKSRPQAPKTQPAVQSPAVQPGEQPVAPAVEAAKATDDQLIGITFWRLREATSRELNSEKRLLLQQKYILDRVAADTAFKRDDMVRLSIEAPRVDGAYIYVIDRELYADGSIGKPHLIFPSRTVRNGDNKISAGKVLDIPASTDIISYFSFDSDRADYTGEQLTIIISPRPLNLPRSEGPPLPLNPEQVAQLREWERDWSGPTERRETNALLGATRTVVERDASEGERLLTQRDPLPQTIYRVKVRPVNPGGCLLINAPLRIAR